MMPSNCEVIRAFKMNGVEVKTLEQYLESALSIMENSLQNESSLPRVETQPPINAVQQPVPTKTNRARINEFCQVNFSQQPEYKYTQGVDEFVCVASIENFEAIGRGKQKSDAREEACGKLLEKLKSPDRLTSQSGTPVSLPPTKSQPIAAPKPQPRPTSPPKESNVREKSPISPSQNPLPPCENWTKKLHEYLNTRYKFVEHNFDQIGNQFRCTLQYITFQVTSELFPSKKLAKHEASRLLYEEITSELF